MCIEIRDPRVRLEVRRTIPGSTISMVIAALKVNSTLSAETVVNVGIANVSVPRLRNPETFDDG